MSRELGDAMYNQWMNYNPYGAVAYATRLRDEFREDVKILDAQALQASYGAVRRYVERSRPDMVTYFLSAFSLPYDLQCVDWSVPHRFFVGPFSVDVLELMSLYSEYPFEKSMFITDPRELQCSPDFNLLDLTKYNIFRVNLTEFCSYGCTFCDRAGMAMRYKEHKEVDEVVHEIAQLSSFGKPIMLFGTELGVNKQMVLEMANQMEQKHLSPTLYGLDRVDLVDAEVYQVLVKNGLSLIQLGVETGSQTLLDQVKKGIRTSDAVEAFHILKRFWPRLKTQAFFIVGFPEERWRSVWESVRLFWQLRPDVLAMDMLYPSPNTDLYLDLRWRGLLKSRRWEFYKHLKRRKLVFHHDFHRSMRDLVRVRCITSLLMDAALLGRPSVQTLRQMKGEGLTLLKSFYSGVLG